MVCVTEVPLQLLLRQRNRSCRRFLNNQVAAVFELKILMIALHCRRLEEVLVRLPCQDSVECARERGGAATEVSKLPLVIQEDVPVVCAAICEHKHAWSQVPCFLSVKISLKALDSVQTVAGAWDSSIGGNEFLQHHH